MFYTKNKNVPGGILYDYYINIIKNKLKDLGYVDNNLFTDMDYELTIGIDSSNIIYVPKSRINRKMIDVIKRHDYSWINNISINLISDLLTEDDYIDMLFNGLETKYIPLEYIKKLDAYKWKYSIMVNWHNIKYIPDKYLNDDLVKNYILNTFNNGMNMVSSIAYLPKKYLTKDLIKWINGKSKRSALIGNCLSPLILTDELLMEMDIYKERENTINIIEKSDDIDKLFTKDKLTDIKWLSCALVCIKVSDMPIELIDALYENNLISSINIPDDKKRAMGLNYDIKIDAVEK